MTYADCMSTMQIRNVPEETSRRLKARAAAAGQSLSEYLLAEVTKIADRPTMAEISARLEALPPLDLPPAADLVRQARSERLG